MRVNMLGTVAFVACCVLLSAVPICGYVQINLVSDGAVPALHIDPNLVNPWGIALGPTSPMWVSDNGAGVSTLYRGDGSVVPLVVTIPSATGFAAQGVPTGMVFNGTASDFHVNGSAAIFLFATEDGVITGWNGGTTAAILARGTDAVYKGLAIGADRLFASDFRNGKVDVYDANFAPVSLPGAFVDPALPAGFAPFGIQNIGGKIFVSYAKQDSFKHDDVPGAGFGFVDIYNTDGVLQKRFATQGTLDSPWGMTLAPATFGPFGGSLLVGNFGDGSINAFNPTTGAFLGQLPDVSGNPIVIDGLWGIAFGNGSQSQPTNSMFFASGPNGEEDGLYGRLDPEIPEPASLVLGILGLSSILCRRRFARA